MKMRWYFSFFLISGFCSLVYEVVWLRLSMAGFGVTTAMVSIVLSMFMAGLGLGSWGAGWLVRRLGNPGASTALRLYALAELLIGISAVLVPQQLKWGHTLLLGLGSAAAWESSAYYLLSGAWVAATLIPWSTCMGATFPLLMAAIRRTSSADSERSFSYLYVANVLGAVLGTTASAFFLIELLGFHGTLETTCSLNGAIAVAAFALSLAKPPSQAPTSLAGKSATERNLYGLAESSVLWMLFTTGLVSMAMEVVWIRQFTPYLGNVVYSFAAILAIYLFATFWGSRDYRLWARAHRAGESAWAWAVLGLLGLIPLAAAEPVLLSLPTFQLGLTRVAVGIFPFCATVGFLTPLLIDYWSSGDPERAGTAYAVNVVGCILGPLLAGFLVLPWLGEHWGLVCLSLPMFCLGALAALRRQPEATPARSRLGPRLRYGLVALAALLLVITTRGFERRFTHRVVLSDSTATVMATGTGMRKELWVNGISMTGLTPITKFMAHVPLAFMPRSPQDGLVVCFGMGTTFRSMLSWGIRATAVDLVPSVPALFGYFHPDAPQILSLPGAQVVVDDGRRFLDGSPLSYDVITMDPPPPPAAAASSLLYSREFYEVARKHLRTGGILQVWYLKEKADAGTDASVAKAITQSFPYVRAFQSVLGWGVHFLASMQPIPTMSASALAARLPPAAAADFVEWGPGTTAEDQFSRLLAHELSVAEMIGEDPRAPALDDDQPVNEYFLLRRLFNYHQ